MAIKMSETKNIGVPVSNPPTRTCDDVNCPYHGSLSVRGRIFEGVVESDKMQKTAVIRRDFLHYDRKYKRYERRHGKVSAHNPPCINAKEGERVRAMECRKLAKSVTFVIIETIVD